MKIAQLREIAPIVVAVLAASGVVVVYLLTLGHPFGNNDEVLYAEFIRAMHQTGDYLTLRYGDTVVYQRPPIPIALYALMSRVIAGELGIRALPAFLTVSACLVTGFAAWRIHERLDVGLVALFLFASAPTVYHYGRLVSSDPPFLLACSLALVATMAAQRDPRWFLWALAAVGATFATKSFAGAIPSVALTPGLAFALYKHRRDPALRIVWSLVAFAVFAGHFFVIGYLRSGQRFIDGHFHQNLFRFAQGNFEGVGHPSQWHYFEHLYTFDGQIMAVLLLGGVLIAGIVAIWRRDAPLGVAACYSVLTLLILGLIKTRLDHYLLPFYPGAAMCIAGLVALAVKAQSVSKLALRAIAPACAGTLFLTNVGEPQIDPVWSPSYETVRIAHVMGSMTSADERVYSLSWYAPALGYYADRRWSLLTTTDRTARTLRGIDIMAGEGTVQRAPPWPNGTMIIAAREAAFERARPLGLRITRVLFQSGPFTLVEAIADDTDTPEQGRGPATNF